LACLLAIGAGVFTYVYSNEVNAFIDEKAKMQSMSQDDAKKYLE
jgi:polyhydroxyalkanoate synthesis regulator phasin